MPYADIPILGNTQVPGHAGQLHCAHVAGRQLLIFQGRRHWYEGEGWEPVILPVFLALKLGARNIVLTNAAGGISPEFAPGDVMLLRDHINWMGSSPLTGLHQQLWGPRFPDLSSVYNAQLSTTFAECATRLNMTLRQGVYLAVAGPCYETPAEIRVFRTLGADAVGMSTVPEATVAHAAGLRVAALSCIANSAAGLAPEPLAHDDILARSQATLPTLATLLTEFFHCLHERN